MRFLKAICLISLLGLAAIAQADVKRSVNFQGTLTDTQGVALPDNSYLATVKLYDAETGGTMVWDGGSVTIVTKSGFFNFALQNIPSEKIYSELWLQIQMNVGGEMLPRIPLNGTLYALQVPDGIITRSKLIAGAVGTTTIASGAVMGGNVGGNTITASNIANGTITGNKLANESVTWAHIVDGTIRSNELGDGCVTNAKIANGAVDTQAKAPWATSVVGASNPKIWIGTITTGTGGYSTGTYHVVISGVTTMYNLQLSVSRSDRGFLVTYDHLTQVGSTVSFDIYTWGNSDDALNNAIVQYMLIGN